MWALPSELTTVALKCDWKIHFSSARELASVRLIRHTVIRRCDNSASVLYGREYTSMYRPNPSRLSRTTEVGSGLTFTRLGALSESARNAAARDIGLRSHQIRSL